MDISGNKHLIILSLGGNTENTRACFEQAIVLLEENLGPLINASSLYRSEAWGFEKPTALFLNKVVQIETKTPPDGVLAVTQQIEKQLGRTSKSVDAHYVDRSIDIDVLFYDSDIIQTKKLTIPHNLIHKRRFILLPLAEIVSDFIHPVYKKSVKELLLQCEDKLDVYKMS